MLETKGNVSDGELNEEVGAKDRRMVLRTAICNEDDGLDCHFLGVPGNVGDVQGQADDVGAEEELGHPKRGETSVDSVEWEGVQEYGCDHADDLAADDDADTALQLGPTPRQIPDATIAKPRGDSGDGSFGHGQ